MEDDLIRNGRRPTNKLEDDLKKRRQPKTMEDNLTNSIFLNRRRPQKKCKMTSSTIKKINLYWL
jgi:hypothetical protein